MTRIRLADAAKLIGTAMASLLVNLPLHLFKEGPAHAVSWGFAAIAPIILVACSEPFRGVPRFQQFFSERSFNGMLFRAFLLGLSQFFANLVNAVWPSANTAGFQFGMFVGLVTPVPYATLDYPNVTNKSYWKKFGAALGAAFFILIVAIGRSYHAVIEGIVASLVYVGGLWLGLVLGNHLNQWIAALQPVFRLLKRLGRILTAFAVGYFFIILVFSAFYAAVWRLQGPGAFVGLPQDPGFPTFLYFSLVTATTIGYGDIVPHSALARSLTGIEAVTSLAWTLVVFAAISVQFSLTSKDESQ
jgi:hypothetical protein